MKDMAHHRLHMQKKVIRDAKKEVIKESPNNSVINQSLQATLTEQDSKRKSTREFVRQMSQRDRAH